jgi:hypothetical protein
VIGDRQIGRIKTKNVLWIKSNQLDYRLDYLYTGIVEHFEKGRFEPSNYYGIDGVAKRFVERLKHAYSHGLKVDV